MTKPPSQIRPLTAVRCRALLRRHHLGRIAFTFKDRVDIEPISYVFDGGWLYARTSRGAKLVQLKHHPWVAFEVDEVRGESDWESVVVHGTAYFLNPGGIEEPEFARALTLLRRVDPRVRTDKDTAPARTIFFRIHVDELAGREAKPAGSRVRGRRAAG